ncbi:MAG: winged helix DNA-binding domain-containing protein [Chitinophagaceae bacterium]
MKPADIIRHRLAGQQITATTFQTPAEVVQCLVAMQAQEFAMAKWAIGLRLPGTTDSVVEKAFNDGAILRTHLMRPTWHFVVPADIRWLLALTAPRVHAANAFMYRKTELTTALFRRSNDALIHALEGGKQLTRAGLQAALQRKKIMADGFRLAYLLMYAELEGILCSGPRQGKQFTYALLDERVPAAKNQSRDESLAAFTRRYFASRGPATLQDFTYWSGLTVKDVKTGAALLPGSFERFTLAGQEYFFLPASERQGPRSTFLLPDYDEYGMSYKDRSILYQPGMAAGKGRSNPVFSHLVVTDGRMAGTWQRTVKRNVVTVETASFSPLTKTKQQALQKAVGRYISFWQ